MYYQSKPNDNDNDKNDEENSVVRCMCMLASEGRKNYLNIKGGEIQIIINYFRFLILFDTLKNL